MDSGFQITGYNQSNFIYEGKDTEEVSKSVDKTIVKVAGGVLIGSVFSVTISATLIGTAVGGPLGGVLGFVYGFSASLFTPIIPFGGQSLLNHNRLKELYKDTGQIHAFEMKRLDDIHTVARSLLGMFGETGPYTPVAHNKELAKLEEEASCVLIATSPETIERVFSQFKKIQALRESVFNTQAEEINKIACTIFQKISELRKQKADLAKALKVSENTDYTPSSSPIFTEPAAIRPDIRKLQVYSHIATLRDQQNLAIRVISVAGEVMPNIQSTLTQANQELEAARVDSAINMEAQAFNTVYLQATRAIDKHKGGLETLKRYQETQTLSEANNNTKETVKEVGQILQQIINEG